jgi:Fe-S cluster biosynthesis and repair protein YggX
MARTVHCIKLNKEAEGLDFPPYPGELGKKLYESVRRKPGPPGSSTRPCWSTKTA